MSLYGIPEQQLERLMYPQGRGAFHYGNTPVQINMTKAPAAPFMEGGTGVQPGGVSAIGANQVEPAIAPASATNAALGVSPGQLPATGMPAGAAAGGVPAGAGQFASIASGAISQIADVASNYVKAKGAADAQKAQQAIPGIPQDDPNTPPGSFQPPALAF